MKLQVKLELPRIVAKQLGGSCTQVGEPGTWNPADPKVSHAQPPLHETANAKKAPAIVIGAPLRLFVRVAKPGRGVCRGLGNLSLCGCLRKFLGTPKRYTHRGKLRRLVLALTHLAGIKHFATSQTSFRRGVFMRTALTFRDAPPRNMA